MPVWQCKSRTPIIRLLDDEDSSDEKAQSNRKLDDKSEDVEDPVEDISAWFNQDAMLSTWSYVPLCELKLGTSSLREGDNQ